MSSAAMRVAAVFAMLTLAAAQEHLGAEENIVNEDDSTEVCEPQKCWADVVGHVDCLLNPRSTRTHECRRLNHTELCKVFEKALQCSSDLADSGCVLRYGRESFDFWIRGLEAVNTKLCFEGLMDNIVAHAECWDAMRFTRCVEHTVDRLHHVVDLADLLAPNPPEPQQAGQDPGQQLRVADSRRQCHLAMLRISKCAAIAAALDPPPVRAEPLGSCLQAAPVDVINEMLAAYFSVSECGGNPAAAAACPPPPQHQGALPEAAPAPWPAPTAPPAPAIAPDRAPAENSGHLQVTLCASGSPAHSALSVASLAAVSLVILINRF